MSENTRPGPAADRPHEEELPVSPNDPAEWDAWAPSYGAEVDWVEEIHNKDLAELAGARGARVLDIGCGTGRRARAVFAGAGRLTAVDSSRGMAAVARRELAGLEHAEVLELDIEKDDLPPGLEFDAAVAVSVMHHLRDARAALERVKSRLVPGGVLVIVDAVTGNGPLAAAGYYLEMLCRHNPLKLAAAFLSGHFLDTRLARHRAVEAQLTLEQFAKRYQAALPGARAERRHGLFGYLVWKKPL
jgi:SAM-dependent methyltransferase